MIRTRHAVIQTVLLLGLFILAPASAFAGDAVVARPAAKLVELTNPREAGIRYGQAAGMAAVCINIKPTSKAENLATSFSGKDLEMFKLQAETVLKSWKKTLACAHTSDPNPCRLVHQMSCREAYREIGPRGTVAPDLVEVATAP